MNRPPGTDEGNFLAGFIEGEAHLAIVEANGGQSFRCLMSLNVRDDDVDLLEWIQERTGLGALKAVPARRTSNPQIQWLVQTQHDCRRLTELLTRFELRGRKRREFEVWRRAVEAWTSETPERVRVGRELAIRLLEVRRFRVPEPSETARAVPADALSGYLHGLLCAEGSFSLRRSKTGLTVHMRQDERPLLRMLQQRLDVGRICDYPAYPPARPSTSWHVGSLDDVVRLASHLDPALMRGRKARELEIWRRAVAERHEARASGRPARIDDLVAEFSRAREYRPGRAPRRRDRHAEARDATLSILRRWAESTDGRLSCVRYVAARESGWPSRNTITHRFGSWDAALRAAGLGDRLARTEPRRVGGEAGRKARAEAQRERVLQTLRYLIAVHGTIPTAMEFFRARLVEAPATPTQATVYRLFPGGWQAVLDALGEVDPAVLCSPAPADGAR